MAYSTLEDLKNIMPASQLVELTDDSDTGDIDIEKLNDTIRRADNFIDAHVRGRYPLPLTVVPDLIRDISTKLARYYLYERSLVLVMPEALKNDYKFCLGSLQNIQMGKVNPFEAGEEPTFYLSNHVATDSVITSTTVTNNWDAYLI